MREIFFILSSFEFFNKLVDMNQDNLLLFSYSKNYIANFDFNLLTFEELRGKYSRNLAKRNYYIKELDLFLVFYIMAFYFLLSITYSKF